VGSVRTLATIGLWLLTVLGMSLGVIAGTVALASLLTETAARLAVTGGDRFARRHRLTPFTSGLRDELAALLKTREETSR
jgi:hypothetical protein